MKKIIITILAVSLFSCGELTDFTDVTNPNLSETSVVGQQNSSSIWLTGVERQMSLLLNEIVINAEIASDNYNNDQTFYNQFLDDLDINFVDDDIADLQFDLHRMREMALFGINNVGPGDPNYTTEVEAEYNFFTGMASLYAGAYFTGMPEETGGIPLSSTENLTNAASSFNAAIGINSLPEYHLALARTHYLLGNRMEAMTAASNALGLSSDFLRSATFDQAEGPVNTMESGLYERGSFDDLQPLPTLDFLDPKYSFVSPAEDAPVHYLKAEEAHLILIEGHIASGDLAAAQQAMSDLAALIGTRSVRNIDDAIENRTHFAPKTRPDSSCVVVNGRAGLVLDRDDGNVNIPDVSGTSLTQDDIDNIASEDEALYLLYRTRQEIFIAEGMRMVDMGVKLVISETEQLQNENVTAGGTGSEPQIPGFLASVATSLDAIEYTPGTCVATTMVDVNQLLVDNKSSAMVLPFH